MSGVGLCETHHETSVASTSADDNDSQKTALERPIEENGMEGMASLEQANHSTKEETRSLTRDQFEIVNQQNKPLSILEKRFLLAVERGDLPAVKRFIREAPREEFNINCSDPLGRSGLLMAIDNENIEMIELLISAGVEMKDALLHAINEEFVEAVELLLDHENSIHIEGMPHSWEAVERETFTNDITPLVLAAHRNNYEIIKIILDRKVSPIPTPHDARCGCKDCRAACKEGMLLCQAFMAHHLSQFNLTLNPPDCLRHSRSRINAYKALSSPSLIALSSKDPILTAFELSWQLRRLSFLEPEFKNEYMELRKQCQTFATGLLDHTRTTEELEVLLNYAPNEDPLENHNRMQLSRLKLAVSFKQKMFCAHANVQQLLASIWYEGLPGFRRKNIVLQVLQLISIGVLFPVLSLAYILAPHSALGRFIKKPFIKFICHSASYITFLALLMLASQRVESDLFGTHSSSNNVGANLTKRGSLPSYIELCILGWVFGLIWSEIKQLWDLGISEYLSDMWNILDFINNSLYVATITLRVIAYYQTQKEIFSGMISLAYHRETWDDFDPILISEGLFATANIFSSLKLVYIFSVNPYLGPLQISLGRMVIDILKFFSIYTLVIFAFACGMNQLLWYYADMEKHTCLLQQNKTLANSVSPLKAQVFNQDACSVWRRFANLFESSQTLFWASYGLIDLNNFDLTGIKSYTRFWGMLMFGVYSVINVTVLLNLLIAMMNHSYQLISQQADTEWKFARSKLWMSYFSDGATVPPPFNIIPTPKSLAYLIRWFCRFCFGKTKKAKNEAMRTIKRKQRKANERDYKYQMVMRALIRRYVMNEQRIQERQRGVTEDDCNEIKQDISALRYELLEMLGARNKDNLSNGNCHFGRKSRQRERRLMKGFNFDFLMMDRVTSFDEDFGFPDNQSNHSVPESNVKTKTSPRSKFSRIAQGIANKKRGAKWRQLIEATRNKVIPFSRSQDSMDSDAMAMGDPGDNSSSHTCTSAEHSVKLDANTKRQIYALKLESISRSQPILKIASTSKASESVPVAGSSKYAAKPVSTLARASGSETTNPVETKLIESPNSPPCDTFAKRDQWI